MMLDATACEVYVSVAVGLMLVGPLPANADDCDGRLADWIIVGAGCAAGADDAV